MTNQAFTLFIRLKIRGPLCLCAIIKREMAVRDMIVYRTLARTRVAISITTMEDAPLNVARHNWRC